MTHHDLSGKTALVTGAGRGIGAGCVTRMAEAGASVVAVARSADDLAALENSHPGITGWQADVTDPAFIEQVEAMDRLDILVNNAGTNRPAPITEVTDEDLDWVLALNVRSAFKVAQAAARAMLRNDRGGSIIHMSSQMGHVGAVNRTVYCMTKHAIEGLTKAMAVELAPRSIRVNAVAPTFVRTPMTEPMLQDPEFQAQVNAMIPMGRTATIDEVAGAVLFLASDASAMITGDSLKVDGGWTAR